MRICGYSLGASPVRRPSEGMGARGVAIRVWAYGRRESRSVVQVPVLEVGAAWQR